MLSSQVIGLVIVTLFSLSSSFKFLQTAKCSVAHRQRFSLKMSGDDDLRQALAKALETIEAQSKLIEELQRYVVVERTSTPPGSLKDLCQISKEACDVLSPMVRAFYKKCSAAYGTSKLKSDATFFSIADGIVQHLLVEHLFAGNKFGQIVGEEDETNVNILSKPFTVDDLVVPEEFEELVETTRNKIQQLAKRIDSSSYKTITIFVDPIDGTREFATGKGDYCSILIGYNNQVGTPVAGIIYRPLTEPPTWAAGAKSENCVMGLLDIPKVPNPRGVLVTDGAVSLFLEKVIEELKFEKVPAYASGNRALMLLEGKAGAYIRDTGGFAKWDTSGPQAVLEAYGGTMSKLPGFLSDKKLESYTYLKSKQNLDFEPDTVTLTLSNAKDKKVARLVRDVLASEVDLVKEYSCLMGLLALDAGNLAQLDAFHAAMKRVQAIHPPTYT
jgi:3'-phosphoadenosine 5'-phosphosulfate (PAPS) 3'-phosphatase